jgi:hypothetical protein
MVGVAGAGTVTMGPKIQSSLVNANLGVVSKSSWCGCRSLYYSLLAPISKCLISGASFLDLPTDKISLAQYTAPTATGFFFTRNSLLVTPINYTLCSVNVTLFRSLGWHLGCKITAGYIDHQEPTNPEMTDQK